MLRLGGLNSISLIQIRRLSSFPLLFPSLPTPPSFSSSFSSSMAAAAALPPPPLAKKVKHEMEMFGDVRSDDYYWLRDDSRSDPDVLSHLKKENDYTDLVMAGVKSFEDELYTEIRGRIQEDDISAPTRKGQYYYYKRTLKGKEYVQYCRRLVTNESSVSVYDIMPMGPEAPAEHVILDENIKAQEYDYYSIGAFKVSPDNNLVAYAEDTKGNEIYTIHVINAENGSAVGKPLVGALTSYLEWAGNDTLVYVTMDAILRPDKVWLHKLSSDQSSDHCLYHEEDEMFSLALYASESKQYLFVSSDSKNTNFIFYLEISKQEAVLMPLTTRVYGIDSSASHRGNHFFIKRRSEEYYNSELVACPVDGVSEVTVLLPHRESVKIQDIQLFNDHIVVCEREGGLPKLTVYDLPTASEAIGRLQGGREISFIDPIYSAELEESQFSSKIVRFSYSSMRMPPSMYDYDMDMHISVLKKTETVLGGFDASNYVTERQWAVASDGTRVPISLLYRKNLARLDGSDPLLLYGYGSYEVCIDPSFVASRLSLVDRGFIYAIAHIRGGGEMGRQWYENGKLLKKRNTFTDFITCAEYLVENKYCSKEKLCINGRSAGGLLIGAVLNMRPDLFKAAVAGVPFVDVVTTMLDPSIPLTTSEWEEWGDPRQREYYFYMKSYSPVDNVKSQNYPKILVTAGLNDPRVMYSEPAKFVAKMREMKTDDNVLLFKCELGAGHFSKSGRFEKLKEAAFTYAFILKALDMIPPVSSL
ncbi:uncharacterized protein M6B38_278960 [Iris pallida]|uniref:Prolyl endopeptidase n=1 Tax=Iris pallida TaxID=29817 RepID=A0AAX6HZM4_IRIPA|nr:uncharacterized protein M6B38_278960 [Iris pallida]